jgi:hypothetical protein
MSAAETRVALDQDQVLRDDLARLVHMIETPHPMRDIRAYVAELEARWPDSEEVRHWAYVLAPPVVTAGKGKPMRSMDKEHAWLRAHGREYPDCWLAIYDDRLITASPDLDEVMETLKNTPGTEGALLFFQSGGPWVR